MEHEGLIPLDQDEVESVSTETTLSYISDGEIIELEEDMPILTEEEQDELGHELLAASRGVNAEAVKSLIKGGANINFADGLGQTALYLVSSYGQLDMARILIKNGANLEATANSETALMRASSEGHADIVDLLLKYDAMVSVVDRYGKTALMHAQDGEIVDLLLKAGAQVNVANKNGETALMLAKDVWSVKLLIKARANVNAANKEGATALMYAQDAEIADVLIKHGAQVNAEDYNGETALMCAQNAEVAKILVASGANLNAVNYLGHTALSLASLNGHAEVVKILVANGANLEVKTQGNTALMMAATEGRTEVVEVLIASGANVEVKIIGHTALDLASARGYAEVVTLLNAHNERLVQIASNIESFEMNHERSTLTAADRKIFLQDATNFNQDNIATALALRLREVQDGDVQQCLDQAKEIVRNARDKYQTEIDSPLCKAATQHNFVIYNIHNQFLPLDISAKILALLPKEDRLNPVVAFAEKKVDEDLSLDRPAKRQRLG